MLRLRSAALSMTVDGQFRQRERAGAAFRVGVHAEAGRAGVVGREVREAHPDKHWAMVGGAEEAFNVGVERSRSAEEY